MSWIAQMDFIPIAVNQAPRVTSFISLASKFLKHQGVSPLNFNTSWLGFMFPSLFRLSSSVATDFGGEFRLLPLAQLQGSGVTQEGDHTSKMWDCQAAVSHIWSTQRLPAIDTVRPGGWGPDVAGVRSHGLFLLSSPTRTLRHPHQNSWVTGLRWKCLSLPCVFPRFQGAMPAQRCFGI